MGNNPRDPVVLIRSNPLERVDREMGMRVRERVKRIRTGPHPAAPSPSASRPQSPPAEPAEAEEPRRDTP